MLNVGGVAVGGRADVPETHASAADKLVGKTQKVRVGSRPYRYLDARKVALTGLGPGHRQGDG